MYKDTVSIWEWTFENRSLYLIGVRVRGNVACAVRAAADPVGAGEQLHLQDVLLPVHQLLLIPRLHRLLQGVLTQDIVLCCCDK